LLASIPIWKMGLTGIWDFADAGIPLYFVEGLLSHLCAWGHHVNTGTNFMPIVIEQTPLLLFSALLEFIGVLPVIINRLILFGAFALAGWGMYRLIKTIFLFDSRSLTRLACISGSMFNMYNPNNIGHLEIGGYNFIVISGMLPLTMSFIYEGFKASQSGIKWLRYSLLTAFSSVVLLTQHREINVLLVPFLGVFCLTLVIKNISKPRLLFNDIKFLSVTFFASIGLNLFWIIPLLSIYFTTSFVESIYSNPYFPERLMIISTRNNIWIQSFRMQQYSSNRLAVFVRGNWIPWITSPANVLVGIVLSCLAYSSLILRRERKVALFAAATALFTALSTGLSPPFGPIYAWLWNNLLIFRAFNNPLKFFHIVQLGYSVLLGVATAEIARRISSLHLARTSPQMVFKLPLPKIFVVIVIFLISFNSYPLFSGNLDGILEPAQIPQYYYEARTWLQDQKGDFRIMMLPQPLTGSYVWTPKQPAVYGMSPISNQFFASSHPVIDMIEARVQPHVTPAGSPDLAITYYLYDLLMNYYSTYTFDMLYRPEIWVDANFTSGWVFIQSDSGVTSYNFTSLGNNKGVIETVTSEQPAGILYGKSVPSISTDKFPYFVARLKGDGESQYLFQLYMNGGMYDSGIQTSPEEAKTLIIYLPPGKSINKVLLQAKCPWLGSAVIHWEFIMFLDSLPQGFSISKMLNLLSIKYLIVSDDLASPGPGREPVDTTTLRDFLEKLSDVKLVERFGALYVYENVGYENTQVYASTNYIFLPDDVNTQVMKNYYTSVGRGESNISDLAALSLKSLPHPYYSDIGVNLTDNAAIPQIAEKKHVNLTYERISPSEYKVNVNAERPFVLIFSETYDEQWSLTTTEGEAVPYHFVINFYANGWYVNKTGDYTLTLYFSPQRFLNQGLYGTIVSATFLLILIFVFDVKRIVSEQVSKIGLFG